MTIDEALKDGPLPLTLLAEKVGRTIPSVLLDLFGGGYHILERGKQAHEKIVYPKVNRQ